MEDYTEFCITADEAKVLCQALNSHAKICDAVAEKTTDQRARKTCVRQAAVCRHIMETFAMPCSVNKDEMLN